MPVTLVKTRWNAGQLEFLDPTGNVIFTIDGTNRLVNVPTGSRISLVDGYTADGLGALMVARFTFNPSAVTAQRSQAAHNLGVTIPAHAVIVGGFFDVNTAFASAAGTAEIALSVEGANDIQTAAAVSGAPYSTIGRKAIVPKANTPESTSVKTTVARAITATVTVQNLTAGRLTGFLYYVQSVASA